MYNRVKEDIYFISSDPLKIVFSLSEGFCALPTTKYEKRSKNDFILNLLEKYLINLRYFKNMKDKNHQNFGYLLQVNSLLKRKNKQIFQMEKKDEQEEEEKKNPHSSSSDEVVTHQLPAEFINDQIQQNMNLMDHMNDH